MTEHKELPEGVQVAIELLQNVPPELLEEFSSKVAMFRDENPIDIWNEIIEKWYRK